MVVAGSAHFKILHFKIKNISTSVQTPKYTLFLLLYLLTIYITMYHQALTELKTLTCLNLNSTKLSAQVFEELVNKLPSLASYDIRYTEAW